MYALSFHALHQPFSLDGNFSLLITKSSLHSEVIPNSSYFSLLPVSHLLYDIQKIKDFMSSAVSTISLIMSSFSLWLRRAS